MRAFWEHWLRGVFGLVVIGGLLATAFLISAVAVAFAYFLMDGLLPSELMPEDGYKRLFVFALSAFSAPYLYSINCERIEEALRNWKAKRDRESPRAH